MKIKHIDKLQWLFFSGIIMYGILLPLGANFGVIDDHTLLGTLFSDKRINFFIQPPIGRFYPLDAQEYNIISFFSLSPIVFYLYNMLQFLVVIFVLLRILGLLFPENNKKYLFSGIILLFVFSPGFVTAWFRLFVPERGALVFFLVFLLMYLLYQKDQKNIYMIVGLTAANIALYYKEPGFLMLGAFGFFHLIFAWKELNVRQKILDVLIIFSSIGFVFTYFIVVYIHKGDGRYGNQPYNQIIIFIKNVMNLILMDPFLGVTLFGLLGYRFYVIVTKKEKIEPLYDSMLLASLAYVLVFFILNMWAVHYFLPAYAFAIFGVAYFLQKKEYIKKIFFRTIIGVTVFFYTLCAFPFAVHLIDHYKNVPNNFQNTLNYIVPYIKNDINRTSIYFDGVNRGSGIEIYKSFGYYLNYKGLNNDQFDFKSNVPSNNSFLFSTADSTSSFTVYKNPDVSQINAGDLLIVTPFSSKNVDKEYLENLSVNYDMIYHADSIIDIPDFNIKNVLKYLFMRYRSKQMDEVVMSNNLLKWSDFYVFKKK